MPVESIDSPVHQIRRAAGRPEALEAMCSFYAETGRLIVAYSPVCHNRGLCCRFGQYGHRLYVTTLEAAYYLATGEPPPIVVADACPHAHGGACHARDRRPLGCRVFFCDPQTQGWQGPLSEERLACLRRLHDELNVSYFYADWLQVLIALQPTKPGS